ncbi:MAG: glycosyltransferase [Leptolyngbyaceae cyanobacterium]
MKSSSKKVLSISQKFSPETNPTAIRSSKTLKYLPDDWQVHMLSGNQAAVMDRAEIHFARSWYPSRLLDIIRTVKLGKLIDWLVWPDQDIFWLLPALLKGIKIVRQHDIDLIIVFLKPYSAGLIGILLKWFTGKPLIINVCEPASCDDLYAVFATKLHYYLDRWLEDFYVKQSDAIVYVSQLSLTQVRARQPRKHHAKFHLIRGGADPKDFEECVLNTSSPEIFEIVFTGGMTGWHEFLTLPKQSLLKRLRHAWMNFGRYHNIKVDGATSSPIFIGRAIQHLMRQIPDWQGRIKLRIYGNKFDQAEIVLDNHDLLDVVDVTGPVSHAEALQKLQKADLLFMPLPNRIDETPGDRISLKTYEYLMTDRPILAAVPCGENRDYLSGKPGVYITVPDDVEGMAEVIRQLFIQKILGKTLIVDRVETQRQISYVRRGEELATLMLDVLNASNTSKVFEKPLVMGTTNIPEHR